MMAMMIMMVDDNGDDDCEDDYDNDGCYCYDTKGLIR